MSEPMELKERILNCLGITGISSQEQAIAAYLLKELHDLGIMAEIDQNGNVKGNIRSVNENAKTLLIEAHMDQVGLMVSGVDEEGFVKFVSLGGIDARILCGAEVEIHAESPLYGVIGSPYPSENPEQTSPKKIEEMRIDIGLEGVAAKQRVKVGDIISFKTSPKELLGDKISASAMDNRAGVAAVLDCLKKLQETENLPYHIKVLFSVGEELGLLGAYTGLEQQIADAAIVVDVTFGQTPDVKEETGVFPLGCGAVICRGPNLHYGYTKQLLSLAKERGIPYDIEVAAGSTGTCAWAIQTAGEGIPSMLISIPLRYMHTNLETLSLHDVQAVSDLLYAAVTGGVQIAE